MRRASERDEVGLPVAVARALADLQFVLDREGRFVRYDAVDPSLLVASPEAFLGRTAGEVLGPLLGARLEAARRAAVTDGEPQSVRYEASTPSGTRYFEARVVPLDGGEVVAFVRDISELVAASSEAVLAQARYRSLRRDAIDGSFRLDLRGHALEVGAALARSLGAEPRRLVGSSLRRFFADAEDFAALVAAARSTSGSFERDVVLHDGDGKPLPVEMFASVVRDADGTALHLQGFVREKVRGVDGNVLLDVAQQRDLVLEAGGLAYWEWSPLTGDVRLGAGCARLLGHSVAELPTHFESCVALFHPEDRPAYEEALGDHVEARTPAVDVVSRVRHADGSWRWIQTRGRVFERDEAGRAVRFCGTHADVTNLRRAESEAREANLQKTRFITTMSHELRTPLNAVLGLSEALVTRTYGDVTPKQEACLQTIHDSGRHLLALINDLLDISRIESGHLSLEIIDTSVSATVGQCVALTSDAMERRGQKLVTDLAPNARSVRADGRRLQQVLLNLLVNASKFSRDGATITLAARRDGVHLELSVRDEGPGIPPVDQARIFEPFVRLEATAERGGIGLGLALVRSLAAAMDGSVRVESDGPGATFVVRLPAAGSEPGSSRPARKRPQSERGFARLGRAPAVLLAEADPANLLTFESYLSAKGYRVLLATDGLGAVAAATDPSIELILLDTPLPDLEGTRALELIRAAESGEARPIVALSGGDGARLLASGATTHLRKPVELHQLTRAIDTLLEARAR